LRVTLRYLLRAGTVYRCVWFILRAGKKAEKFPSERSLSFHCRKTMQRYIPQNQWMNCKELQMCQATRRKKYAGKTAFGGRFFPACIQHFCGTQCHRVGPAAGIAAGFTHTPRHRFNHRQRFGKRSSGVIEICEAAVAGHVFSPVLPIRTPNGTFFADRYPRMLSVSLQGKRIP